MTEAKQHSNKNEKLGSVLPSKMAKTIVVEVIRRVPHPLYKRIVSKKKKFYAHDEQGLAKVGDVVRIVECRDCAVEAEALGAEGGGPQGRPAIRN